MIDNKIQTRSFLVNLNLPANLSQRNAKIKKWRISLWWLINVVTLPLSDTPSSPCLVPLITCLEPHLHLAYHHLYLVYHHLHLVYHHLCLAYHHPCLVSHHPYLVPHLCLVSHHMTGTAPCVWNPIQSSIWYPIPVPLPHHLAHSTPSPSGHCCSYPGSNWPLSPELAPACPPSWTLVHGTLTTASNCYLALIHPPIPPPGQLAFLALLPLTDLAPCHQPPISPPLPSGPPAPCHPQQLPSPPSPAIWYSWPQLPVPSGSLPLPLLSHYPHPNLDLLPPPHQISSPKVPST